jgi:putative flippase GtrA
MVDLGMPTLGVGTPRRTTHRQAITAVPQRVGLTDRAAGPIRMARFAAVGATGTVVNLGVMAALLAAGSHYVLAAIVAAEVSIVGNFLLQERFVFQDRRSASSLKRRFLQAVGFNNLEALARLPLLVLLVELLRTPEILAQALTLAVAFLLRFTFMSRVVYRAPLKTRR